MRVLVVVALLVGAAVMILLRAADLAQDLARRSCHASPDLKEHDDRDVETDEFTDST